MAFEISPCRTTVVVGICDAPPEARFLPDWVTDAMWHAVAVNGARCLTGVFGRCADQMSDFVEKLQRGAEGMPFRLATTWPLAQEWAGAAQDEGDYMVQVFPSYTLLLGKIGRAHV